MTIVTPEEKQLVDLGYQRYQHSLEQFQKYSLNNLSDWGAQVLQVYLDDVAKKIKFLLLNSVPHINGYVTPEVLAFIGLSTVVNYIEPDSSFFSLSYKIGALVEVEHNAKFIEMPSFWNRKRVIKELRKANNFFSFSKAEKTRIGHIALIAIQEVTNLIEVSKIRKNKRTYRVVSPTNNFFRFQDGIIRNACYLSPVKKPLIHFPIPIDEHLIGGYAFDVMSKSPILLKPPARQLRTLRREGNIKKIINILNKTQSVPYEIDTDVLDVAWEMYTEEKTCAGLPSTLIEYPKRPVLPSVQAEKTWKAKWHLASSTNKTIQSKRINTARSLMVAREMREEDHFYFPVCIDSRGRIYYQGDYLNPQGTDLSKALLRFKSKEKINIDDKFWYYVHGANVMGIKGSYQDRFEWVEKNKIRLCKIAKNPKKHINLWKDADEPFQFLSFCFDLSRYLKDPDNYESGLRLSLDASSSGLQILSMLLRDGNGARSTNVVSNGSLMPSDSYSSCFSVLLQIIEKDAQSGLEPVSGHAQFWIDFFKGKKTRDLVKRPLMTTVYSLSRWGLQNYVEDWVREYDLNVDLRKLKYLGDRVNESIQSFVSGATKAMDWIKEVTSILNKNNYDLELLLPNGFYLISSYRYPKSKQVKTILHGTAYYTRYNVKRDSGRLMKGKSLNAAVPNVVHGLDAAILYEFMNEYPASLPVSLVHDCISFKASESNLVYELIRESIIKIFTPNLLQVFKEQLEKKYNLSLPDIPELGDLDINDIRYSSYIYH